MLNRRIHALSLILVAASLARCSCEEIQEFRPSARYTPLDEDQSDLVLNFGNVAVNQEKKLDIRVLSDGSAALIVNSASRVPDNAETQAIFAVNVQEDLTTGLRPAVTSSISVTYRPCPAAWTGNQINPDFDFNTCPSARQQITLAVVDNTRLAGVEIVVAGQPVQAPSIEVLCGRGAGHCNDADVEMQECVSLSFGTVSSAAPACDLWFEIRNVKRGGKETGPLNVERLEILAFDINEPEPRTVRAGRDIGFSLLDMAGNPLAIDSGNPLVVEIPPGTADNGSVRIRARFDGTTLGVWRGEAMRGSGLRIYTDDPDFRPAKTVSFSAIGSAPEIQVLPRSIEYGPVPQGSTRTATVTVSNSGDADLEITDVRFAQDTSGVKFRYTTSRGNPPFTVTPFANNTFQIFVDYTPQAGGQDSDSLVIGSNDVNDNPLEVPITGGAVPKLRVEPNDTLVFALPNPLPPPPIPARDEPVSISNVGFGDLRVLRLSITGPGGDASHPSVDDFSIQGCATLPCMPGTLLCAPSQQGCVNSETSFTITYDNNDNSQTDLAELRIETNDPTDPEHIVVLSAQDVPCFFPSPVVTVVTAEAKVGMPVEVSALSSDPGGAPGMPGSIVDYQWFWLFTPGAAPSFTSQGMPNTTFVPERFGAHVLGLHVRNDCGAMSQTPASETITVQP